MPSVYDQLLGSTRKNTQMQTFANAVRKLSTAYRRVQNMEEAQKLRLKWAEETHNAQMMKVKADLDLKNQQLEERDWMLQNAQQEAQQKTESREQFQSGIKSFTEAYLQYKKKGDPKYQQQLYDAMGQVFAADPEAGKDLKYFVEGIVGAETGLDRAGAEIMEIMKNVEYKAAQTKKVEAETGEAYVKAQDAQIEAASRLGTRAWEVAEADMGFELQAPEDVRDQMQNKLNTLRDTYDSLMAELRSKLPTMGSAPAPSFQTATSEDLQNYISAYGKGVSAEVEKTFNKVQEVIKTKDLTRSQHEWEIQRYNTLKQLTQTLSMKAYENGMRGESGAQFVGEISNEVFNHLGKINALAQSDQFKGAESEADKLTMAFKAYKSNISPKVQPYVSAAWDSYVAGKLESLSKTSEMLGSSPSLLGTDKFFNVKENNE